MNKKKRQKMSLIFKYPLSTFAITREIPIFGADFASYKKNQCPQN